MGIDLLIHNFGSIISAIMALGLSLFAYFNNRKKIANIMLSLTLFSVTIFSVFHTIGVNVSDHHLSRNILMFSLSMIFISLFSAHCVLAIIGKNHQRRFVIAFLYIIAIGMTIFFALFPDTFLLNSSPKFYFPNYYDPGAYNWIMIVIFAIVVPLYLLFEMAVAYRNSNDTVERNRFKYFFPAIGFGWIVSLIPIFPAYNIPANPAWGVFLFIFIYGLPFVYGVVRYELLDIRLFARNVFFYGVAVIISASCIMLFNFSNNWIGDAYPGFPFWVIPFLFGALAVAIGFFLWSKIRRGDILKYEFVAIITHKFRTPLTYIKWSAENLARKAISQDVRQDIESIEKANLKLIELTNLLVNLSDLEKTMGDNYTYRMDRADISELCAETLKSFYQEIELKGIMFNENIQPEMFADADQSRIKFVIQTLVQNALTYTEKNGKISVSLLQNGREIIFSVADSGIGFEQNEKSLLFSKFFRSKSAVSADTEGMGIGLYISRKIIYRHGGKMLAKSEGKGKGSIFSFSLPVA